MNRRQFLEELKEQLSLNMQEGRVAAHLRYYEDYIQSRMQQGMNEEQVLRELGDPRLIARTLLDTDRSFTYDQDPSDHYRGYRETYETEETCHSLKKRFAMSADLQKWIRRILFLLILILIVSAAMSLFVSMLPFLGMLALVLLVLRILDRNR